jgi:hypothetical protein
MYYFTKINLKKTYEIRTIYLYTLKKHSERARTLPSNNAMNMTYGTGTKKLCTFSVTISVQVTMALDTYATGGKTLLY